MAEATGDVITEAQFDPKFTSWVRILISGYFFISVVGILLIPFWWMFSFWYGAEYMRRVSARLTTNALEVKKGVFFRKESTIPLNRITDLRLHDGPLMRHYGLRGLKVETAGSGGGEFSSSEGDLIGVIDAEGFRNAVLAQRQRVIEAETGQAPAVAAASATASDTLVEIRNILARIESHLARGDNE